jgi:hypothetical protein
MIPPFFEGIYSRPFQIAAVDEVTDCTSGDGEELRDISDFDERRNWLFFERGTICNHRVEFLGILTRL